MAIEFFVDAGLSQKMVEGLRTWGFTNIVHIHEIFKVGTLDVEWLDYVGEKGLVVITKDKNIRRNPMEKAALIQYKIIAFYLGGDKMSVRDMAKQLVNSWDKMEACAERQKKKGVACAFIIKPRGGKIEEIPLT